MGVDEGDADCVGVGVGVDEGACAGVEPHVPEVSGDCRIVRFSRSASSVMRTVIPPSDVSPHEGEDTVWPGQFFNGVAQPSFVMFVTREPILDWHTIWTG